MKQKIKRFLILFPLIGNYFKFKQRYNEPRAISFFRFVMFNVIPTKYLKYIYKRLDYMPVDRYSSDIRGNVFIGACSRIQRQGCYMQGRGKLFLGDYVEIASNVCIISGNHDVYDQDSADLRETIIGDNCWIASNVTILAGVVLGPRTIVGAGSVVTKSYPEGYCIIAGNPAKVIRNIDASKVVTPKDDLEFYGYLPAYKFKQYFHLYYKELKFNYDISKVSANVFFQNKNKYFK